MIVEKNVPVPKDIGIGRQKYPFNKMDVGDSVLVPGTQANTKNCKAYAAAINCGRRNQKRFTGRKEPGVAGVRIWRIA